MEYYRAMETNQPQLHSIQMTLKNMLVKETRYLIIQTEGFHLNKAREQEKLNFSV